MKQQRTREAIEVIAKRIVKKSGANLQNPHYLKWVAREITDAVNDSALLEICKSEHVGALEADRERLQNELKKAKDDIDRLTKEL